MTLCKVLLLGKEDWKENCKASSSFQALESHQALQRRIVRLVGDESVSQIFAEGARVELRKGDRAKYIFCLEMMSV